ncbi:alpha/beta hydrolase [Kribbella capetownensis]|uniref:Alpha/beta hydrolase n=1 Tax=Kribbella capetownensis TaxID=1572659 RepID=A0A4V2M6H9_9ACTN|nr:alpha/beta hydrolase [Kribbella capetownensis]TCC43792.1 alpha/beta hydrolase [Kribbella capetownensis]
MTKNIASAARPAPPIGGFQEVDGRRVFVHRLGSGGPAVVFLPGAGAVGLDYFAVQQGVSQFRTAVVYDRGGTGYSDPLPLPLPRTAAAVSTELYELLHAQDIAAPYVLVAHSLGGAHAQRFTQLYPQEVAGLVWLDGFHRDWEDFMPAAASPAADQQMAPRPEQIAQMRPALHEMFAELLADYPHHLRQPLIDAHVSDEWLRVGIAERRSLVALADELRAGPDIPDVPVVALTADGTDPGVQAAMPEQAIRAIHEGMRRMAAAVVSTVSFGEHRIVPDVGHHQLCFRRPGVVVQAIRDVVDRATRA